jgi:ATP-dependent helicase HrpB
MDALSLRWLDTPPAPALAQARELLVQLGAIDGEHRITSHGRAMASFGVHPRLAHMMLRGHELGFGATACVIAALLDERDPMRHGSAGPRRRHPASSRDRRGTRTVEGVDRDTVQRVREHARGWRATLRVPPRAIVEDGECGRALVLAFPDRVAQRRSGTEERYLLRNGLGAVLPEGSSLTGSAYLAVAELGGQRPDARVQLAAAIARQDIEELLGDDVRHEDVVEWRAADRAIVALRRERLGTIVLRETAIRDADPTAMAAALLSALTTEHGLTLTWSEDASRVRARLAFCIGMSATGRM